MYCTVLEHKGHREALDWADVDSPLEPKRFFKLPRGKDCSLLLHSPHIPLTSPGELAVTLVATRGERFPSQVGKPRNRLATATFRDFCGKQYEILAKTCGEEGQILEYEVTLLGLQKPHPDACPVSTAQLTFKLNLATEDPREHHYYVYLLISHASAPANGPLNASVACVSPPFATKKRMTRPIEQSKWKSSIQFYQSSTMNFSSSHDSKGKTGQAGQMGSFILSSAPTPPAPAPAPAPAPVPQQAPIVQSAAGQMAQLQASGLGYASGGLYPGQGLAPLQWAPQSFPQGIPQQHQQAYGWPGLMQTPNGLAQIPGLAGVNPSALPYLLQHGYNPGGLLQSPGNLSPTLASPHSPQFAPIHNLSPQMAQIPGLAPIPGLSAPMTQQVPLPAAPVPNPASQSPLRHSTPSTPSSVPVSPLGYSDTPTSPSSSPSRSYASPTQTPPASPAEVVVPTHTGSRKLSGSGHKSVRSEPYSATLDSKAPMARARRARAAEEEAEDIAHPSPNLVQPFDLTAYTSAGSQRTLTVGAGFLPPSGAYFPAAGLHALADDSTHTPVATPMIKYNLTIPVDAAHNPHLHATGRGGHLQIGDVVLEPGADFVFLPQNRAEAAVAHGHLQTTREVQLDETSLSYSLQAAYWKSHGQTGEVDIKLNGTPLTQIHVEWEEQQLLDNMEDWLSQMSHGNKRGNMRQQERNEEALLSELKALLHFELNPDARHVMKYFITVALDRLEFHRKRDSYAMFITRLELYAHLLASSTSVSFADPTLKSAFRAVWTVIQAEKHPIYQYGFKLLFTSFIKSRHFVAKTFQDLGELLHNYCAQHWAAFNVLVTLGACQPTVQERGIKKEMRKIYREMLAHDSSNGTASIAQELSDQQGLHFPPVDAETLVYHWATDIYKQSVEMPKTKWCVTDAKKLSGLLSTQTHRCTAHTTFNKHFTKDAFDHFLSRLPSLIKPNLQLLISIHSHAVKEGGETFVCPYDANPSNLQRTGISMSALRASLRALLNLREAKGVHIALYLDCCHGGVHTENLGESSRDGFDDFWTAGGDGLPLDQSTAASNAASRQSSFEQIAASASHQKALEKEPYGSYLTFAVCRYLEELQGLGGFYEAYKFARSFVSDKTGRAQTPVYSRFTSGEGQFQFTPRKDAPILRLMWPRTKRIWQMGVPFVGPHYGLFLTLLSETLEGSKTLNRNIKDTIMDTLALDNESELEYAYKQLSLPTGRVPEKVEQYHDITTFIDDRSSLVHIRAPELYRVFLLKVQADLTCHDTLHLRRLRAIRYATALSFATQTSPRLHQAAALLDCLQKGKDRVCLFAWRTKAHGGKELSKNKSAPSFSAAASGPAKLAAEDADLLQVPDFDCVPIKRLVKSLNDTDHVTDYTYDHTADIAFLKHQIIVAVNCRKDETMVGLLFKVGWNSDGHLERALFKELPPISKLSYGTLHLTCLTKDGDIYCFGANNEHQLGVKNPNPTKMAKANVLKAIALSPDPQGHPRTFVDIASGDIHNLALTNDGKVVSWGGNGSGQLGRKKTEEPREISSLGGVRHISCGAYSSAATTIAGSPRVWGFCKAEGLLRQQLTPRTLTVPLRKGIHIAQVLLGTTTALLVESVEPPQPISSPDCEELLALDRYTLKLKPKAKVGFTAWVGTVTILNHRRDTDTHFAFQSRLTNALIHVDAKVKKSGRYFALAPGVSEKFHVTIVPLPVGDRSEVVSGSILLNVRGSLASQIKIPDGVVQPLINPSPSSLRSMVHRFPTLFVLEEISADERELLLQLRLHAQPTQADLAGASAPVVNMVGLIDAKDTFEAARERMPRLVDAEGGAIVYKKLKSLLRIAHVLAELEHAQICCRDLELENWYLNSREQPVLRSLERSIRLGRRDKIPIPPSSSHTHSHSLVLLRAQPPESFTRKAGSSVASMVFSFGVLIFEFLSATGPSGPSDATNAAQWTRVVRSRANLQEGIVVFGDDDPLAPSWQLRALYRACCLPAADKRPSLPSIISTLRAYISKLKEASKTLSPPPNLATRRSSPSRARSPPQQPTAETPKNASKKEQQKEALKDVQAQAKASKRTGRIVVSSTTRLDKPSDTLISSSATSSSTSVEDSMPSQSPPSPTPSRATSAPALALPRKVPAPVSQPSSLPTPTTQPAESPAVAVETAATPSRSKRRTVDKMTRLLFGSLELHTIGPLNFDAYYDQVRSTEIILSYASTGEATRLAQPYDGDQDQHDLATILALANDPKTSDLLSPAAKRRLPRGYSTALLPSSSLPSAATTASSPSPDATASISQSGGTASSADLGDLPTTFSSSPTKKPRSVEKRSPSNSPARKANVFEELEALAALNARPAPKIEPETETETDSDEYDSPILDRDSSDSEFDMAEYQATQLQQQLSPRPPQSQYQVQAQQSPHGSLSRTQSVVSQSGGVSSPFAIPPGLSFFSPAASPLNTATASAPPSITSTQNSLASSTSPGPGSSTPLPLGSSSPEGGVWPVGYMYLPVAVYQVFDVYGQPHLIPAMNMPGPLLQSPQASNVLPSSPNGQSGPWPRLVEGQAT